MLLYSYEEDKFHQGAQTIIIVFAILPVYYFFQVSMPKYRLINKTGLLFFCNSGFSFFTE